MKKLELNQMENLEGGKAATRPRCTWEYAGNAAGLSSLLGAGAIFAFGIAMLYCE